MGMRWIGNKNTECRYNAQRRIKVRIVLQAHATYDGIVRHRHPFNYHAVEHTDVPSRFPFIVQ
jgi:hypothetical protein